MESEHPERMPPQRRSIFGLICWLRFMMHMLVIAAVMIPPETTKCNSLQVSSFDWLENATSETKLNGTACETNDCANQILKSLNEIHQDLAYANKTMSLERMSMRASNRLSDVEGVLSQYETAMKDSQDSLNRSIDHLASFCAANKKGEKSGSEHTADLIESVSKTIDSLESGASEQETGAQASHKLLDETGLDKLSVVMLRVESTEKRHKNSMRELQHVQEDLRNLTDGEEFCKGSCDGLELEPGKLEIALNTSQTILSEQLQESSLLKQSSHDVQTRARQLASLSEQFTQLAGHSRASELISARLFFPQAHARSEELLEDRLSSKLHEAGTLLNNSRETLDRLIDLRRSIKLDEEREANEQLSLLKMHKDHKDISRRLEELALRLNESRQMSERLGLGLTKLGQMDRSLATSLSESTRALAMKNEDLRSWHESEVEKTRQEITKLVDQLANGTGSSAKNWTEILQLDRTVQTLIDTMLNWTSSVGVDPKWPRQETRWTRDSLQSVLTSIEKLRANEVSDLSNRMALLRRRLILSSSHVERARSQINEARSRLEEANLQERKFSASHANPNSPLNWLRELDNETRRSIRRLRIKLDRASSLIVQLKVAGCDGRASGKMRAELNEFRNRTEPERTC